MQATTVLPMRFGTVMPDEETVVARLLGARSDELRAAPAENSMAESSCP